MPSSTATAGKMAGAVGAGLAAAIIAILLKRRRRVPKSKRCACRDRSSNALAPECPLANAVSVESPLPEPWQGTGVIRALGVKKVPEESISDVMAEFYDRLLRDTETKDVEIEMSNGCIHAHSVVLCASSDAIKGILRHTNSGVPRKLTWREYPVQVGNFLLRLLYTGTVDDQDFATSDVANDSSEHEEVPLHVLLGSFEIAMIYLITHVLPALVQVLQHRLAVDTFNSICTSAIKVDAMALRLHCLQYARGNPQNLKYEDFRSNMRVRALRQIDHEHADVPAGTIGTVRWGHGDWLDIHWSCHPEYTNGLQEVLGSIEVVDHKLPGKTLREIYDAEEFSPEVMSELAAIWGQARPLLISMKRRPRRIM